MGEDERGIECGGEVHVLAAERVKALGYARVLVSLFADAAQESLSHFVILKTQNSIGPCTGRCCNLLVT